MSWKRTASSGLERQPMTRIRSRTDSDVEKVDDHEYDNTDEEEDDDSRYFNHDPQFANSRSTSSSNQPMLSKAFSFSNRPSYLIRFPNSIMRYICLGVAVIILIFMLSLIRMSQISAKEVEVAIEEQKVTPKPRTWEAFPFLERFYGGVRALVPTKANIPEYPQINDDVPLNMSELAEEANQPPPAKRAIQSSILFDPYPDYNSAEYITKYGAKVECFLDVENTVSVPRVRIYEGIPRGFPEPAMGSYDLLGLRNDICYDRFGRLGPYGLGYSINRGGSGAQQEGEREGADLVWQESPEVDFRSVNWGDVQKRCVASNNHRFVEAKMAPPPPYRTMPMGFLNKREASTDFEAMETKPSTKNKSGGEKLPRTAVIIRTWWDYPYTPEDIIYLRSLISELNVHSGGEYIVHFLVHVKDDALPIWADDETYQRVLNNSLPLEFRGMGTLWTEKLMLLLYGGLEETWMRDLPVHGVYRSTFMPMQWFADQHPEFDYFWNWEMDIRTTHHWYHFFDTVRKWARKQPRKLLWERNSRFYVPSKHGSWEDFTHMVRIQTEQGTNSANNMWSALRHGDSETPGAMKQAGDKPIWGPARPLDDDVAFEGDPMPPTSFEKDKYTWGVDEEADLIIFNPLFDPEGTTWLLADDTTGYNNTRGRPIRRTAIITASRLSRKLLTTMHRETAIKKHTMFSEMWPASAALHHGLKAVYVPHPEYVDRKWPVNYLEAVFNGGRNGATGGARTSVFGDREHNFIGTTWYYNAAFPEVLWHRFLGMRFHDGMGEAEEMAGEGRMCLPGMLLHPIKRVDLPQEGKMEGQ